MRGCRRSPGTCGRTGARNSSRPARSSARSSTSEAWSEETRRKALEQELAMQHKATAIVSVDRDHVAGELRTRADDMRGVLRCQGAQAREALRTLLVDRFDCTPVLVAGTRGYAFTGQVACGGRLACS